MSKKGNPQTENGFTRIANELLEELVAFDLSASELRIALTVIRLTYGYQTSENKISLTQISKMTGFGHRVVARSVRSLVDKRIIERYGSTTKFNKHYNEWRGSDQIVTDKIVTDHNVTVKNVTKNSDQIVTATSDQIVTSSFPYIKEKKEKKETPSAHTFDLQKFLKENPKAVVIREESNDILPF